MSLSLRDEDEVRSACEDLRSTEHPTNWILLGYVSGQKHQLELVGTGTGGVEDMASNLTDDHIRFSLVEVTQAGDKYNPVKYILVIWIGPDVGAGLARARCAGHVPELVQILKDMTQVSSQYQPSSRADITLAALGGKITHVANESALDACTENKQMSRSRIKKGSGGSRNTSNIMLVEEEMIIEKIKEVNEGKMQWILFGYVEGTRDNIELIKCGTGLEDLRKEVDPAKVFFALISMQVDMPDGCAKITKYLLMTYVGVDVGPLTKARTGSHRTELAEFVHQIGSFHSHYQALSESDITEENLLDKLRYC